MYAGLNIKQSFIDYETSELEQYTAEGINHPLIYF